MGNELHVIVAALQDRVAETLASGVESRLTQIFSGTTLPGGKNLWQQLLGEEATPKGLNLDFLHPFNILDLPSLLNTDQDPSSLLQGVFAGPKDTLRRLLEARSPAGVLAAIREVATGHVRDLLEAVGPLIGRQTGILFSLLTTGKNLFSKEAADAVQDAYLKYFFTKEGYETVDKIRIVAPVHLADVDLENVGQLKALFSERTAERYVRDLVRLLVEAADDVRYDDLKSRYAALLGHVSQARPSPAEGGKKSAVEKFTEWFKGFASVAESAVIRAVEEAALGVSQFQTNALIAASAGTFAGTAARKAAQHVFLSELEALRLQSLST